MKTQPEYILAENRKLREMLATALCSSGLYKDDGELSDCTRYPAIDYLRDSADEIKRKLQQRNGF